MRKPSQDEVAATAKARLEQLARELDRAGVTRLADAEPTGRTVPVTDLPPPAVVPAAGRHAAPPGPRAGLRERVLALVPDTVRGRTGLDRGALRVVVLLAVAGVLLAGLAWSRSHESSTPVSAAARADPLVEVPAAPRAPTTEVATSPEGATGTEGATEAEVAGPVPGEGLVTVHVAGRVRDPGVVELETGSRVVDALEQAGGARRGVDLSGLNLARVLVDGEQLLVGRPVDLGGAAPTPGGPAAVAPGAGTTGPLVSLNTADLALLDTLPGVGPVTAQKILDWRSTNGVFSAVEELLEIDGIGEKTLAEIVPHVTL